jgi:SAM-dependent methyltransferase
LNPAEFANIAKVEQEMWWFRGMNRILFCLLRDYNGPEIRDVLEGGCGTGYLSTLLERQFRWRMTAVDLSELGCGYARGLGLDRVAQADVSKLPFRDGAFDGLVSMDVLVHFPQGQERAAMDEFVRVVRPQGLFAIRVSALDALRSRHSEFAHEQQRFTKTRLLNVAREAGIDVLRCTYLNSLLLPVSLTRFRLWEPLTRQQPASGVHEYGPVLDKLLGFPLNIEEKWLGAGLNFPLGQSLLLIGRRR